MNQILNLKSKNNENNIKINKKPRKYFMVYKFQFTISILLFIVIVVIYFFSVQIKNSKENLAHQITNSYSISKLYSNNNISKETTFNQNGNNFTVIGMIEIPKISIYYPIISEANDELLKISPCRIAGPMPNELGNLCIAGHNYDNYKFFSKISTLSKKDKIKIYNIDGTVVLYNITDIYEVSASDLSPISQSDKTTKQVTLITCNNFNSARRIIIKAYAE